MALNYFMNMMETAKVGRYKLMDVYADMTNKIMAWIRQDTDEGMYNVDDNRNMVTAMKNYPNIDKHVRLFDF